MRPSVKLVALAAALLVGGAAGVACSNPSAGLVLDFPDDTQAQASTLDLYVLHPLPVEDLCAMLTRTSSPLQPTSPDLVRDAAVEDVTVADLVAGAGPMLSSLPSGDKIFFVRVADTAGAPFLHGCLAADLGGGASLEIALQRIGGAPSFDAAPDATSDAPSAPPDVIPVDPDLTVIVVHANNPTLPVAAALVTIDDGILPRTAEADANGRVVFADVASLERPYDVTVVAITSEGGTTYRVATTLFDVAPVLSGGAYLVRVALETSPPVEGGSATISGTVTSIPVASTAEVQVRTPLIGPYTAPLAASGPYAITNLKPSETYSAALLVRDALGQVERVLVTLAVSVGAIGGAIDDYDAAAAVPLDVPANVTLLPTPAALAGASRTLGLDVLLPRGPIELRSLASPSSPVSMVAPSLSALSLGSVLLFRHVADDAFARFRSEARATVTAPMNPINVSLALPAPATISSPASGATVTEAVAQDLDLVWSTPFLGHRFVHARLAGSAGSTIYRWNLVAPAGTTTLSLPAVPSTMRLLVAGVSYDLTVTASSTGGTFVYAASIAADYLNWVRAFDAPRRASHTTTFSVVP